MSVYFIVSYDIKDEKEYKKYNPESFDVVKYTIEKHGGKIIVATKKEKRLLGSTKDVTVIIEFPTKDDALAWDIDPDYADIKKIRINSTSNIDTFIVDTL